MKTPISQTQPDSDRKAQLEAELSKIRETEAREEARQNDYNRALYTRGQVRERLEIGRQKLTEYTRLAEEFRTEDRRMRMSLDEFCNPSIRPSYDQVPGDNALNWLEHARWQEWRLSYLNGYIAELEAEFAAADAVFEKFCSVNGWPVPTA